MGERNIYPLNYLCVCAHVCFLTIILIATLDKIIYFSYSEFSTGYYRLRILIFGNAVYFMQLETYSSILKEILTFSPSIKFYLPVFTNRFSSNNNSENEDFSS